MDRRFTRVLSRVRRTWARAQPPGTRRESRACAADMATVRAHERSDYPRFFPQTCGKLLGCEIQRVRRTRRARVRRCAWLGHVRRKCPCAQHSPQNYYSARPITEGTDMMRPFDLRDAIQHRGPPRPRPRSVSLRHPQPGSPTRAPSAAPSTRPMFPSIAAESAHLESDGSCSQEISPISPHSTIVCIFVCVR